MPPAPADVRRWVAAVRANQARANAPSRSRSAYQSDVQRWVAAVKGQPSVFGQPLTPERGIGARVGNAITHTVQDQYTPATYPRTTVGGGRRQPGMSLSAGALRPYRSTYGDRRGNPADIQDRRPPRGGGGGTRAW